MFIKLNKCSTQQTTLMTTQTAVTKTSSFKNKRTDELFLLKQIFLIYFECFLCWALRAVNFNFMSRDEIVMIIHLKKKHCGRQENFEGKETKNLCTF
jgi:hypothetical protein